MKTYTRKGYKCVKCGHVTYPRTPGKPRVCGGCKNAYWEHPRRDGRAMVQPQVLQETK